MSNYEQKFQESIKNSNYQKLPQTTQEFIKQKAFLYKFSFQELRQIVDFATDFIQWNEKSIEYIFCDEYANKQKAFNHIREVWQELKREPKSYQNSLQPFYKDDIKKFKFKEFKSQNIALGSCPVASHNTRCCNLLTLDAVQSCGFDCSYCSIQSFYNKDDSGVEKIGFDKNFAQNLKNLKLDKNEVYHIGTGQSSDSLMWGNQNGILDALFEFARANPNVILEFKTKSSNISYFLENDVPKNIICTWSLNTPTVIENEEHLTATLEKRLESAKKLEQKGVLIGFHFHPIVVYDNYLDEYDKLYARVLSEFDSKNIVLISFGTLTFTKPVISKIRDREFKTKILQMPFVDANKKFSYPLEEKKQMFKRAYEAFKPWHKDLFFYMCMEDKTLWSECFGYEYATNEEFEKAMKKAYLQKITTKQGSENFI